MTQGKIERYHRSMKNEVLLDNYHPPGQLEARLAEFVDYYNLGATTRALITCRPADVFFGRGQSILTRRRTIKLQDLRATTPAASPSAASNFNSKGARLLS